MEKLFKICFYTGILFAAITFVLGHVFDLFDIDGVDIDFNLPGMSLIPLKPSIIFSFITVFGGVGMMCVKAGKGTILSLFISSLLGITVAYLMYRLLLIPLYKAQNTSSVSQRELIGLKAKVEIAIKNGGFGKISYNACGNLYNAPAKSLSNKEICKGEEVNIIKIEKNVFYVDKL